MKALIDPRQSVFHVTGWEGTPPKPIWTPYPNSKQVCQVESDDQIFPVAEPLYWTDCPNEVIAGYYYYDSVQQQFFLIGDPPPKPAAADQPTTTGTTTI